MRDRHGHHAGDDSLGAAARLAELEGAISDVVDHGHAVGADLALALVARLRGAAPDIDAQAYVEIHCAIFRAIYEGRALQGATYDSPERARWREIGQLSRACLTALVQEWRATIVRRRPASPRSVPGAA